MLPFLIGRGPLFPLFGLRRADPGGAGQNHSGKQLRLICRDPRGNPRTEAVCNDGTGSEMLPFKQFSETGSKLRHAPWFRRLPAPPVSWKIGNEQAEMRGQLISHRVTASRATTSRATEPRATISRGTAPRAMASRATTRRAMISRGITHSKAMMRVREVPRIPRIRSFPTVSSRATASRRRPT